MKRLWILCSFILLYTVEGMADETVRCGSKIVKIGMTTSEVLKYCGKPSSKEVEEHDVYSGNRVVGKTELHRWTYERGYTGKPKVLEFDQDILITIN